MSGMVGRQWDGQGLKHGSQGGPPHTMLPSMTSPRKALPFIDTQRCTGCGWCVAVCPPHVLSLQVLGEGTWGAQTLGAARCAILHRVCAVCRALPV